MSRIGKRPIEIPDPVSVTTTEGEVEVKGADVTLNRSIPDPIKVSVSDGHVRVEPKDESDQTRALWGTTASHIKNMIQGVTEGFEKKLTFSGIGYRANVQGNNLILEMGYSHDVELEIPDGLLVSTEKDTITVSGPDKAKVGQFAALVRDVREPEPYKGSGIKYADEKIRRKEGKKAV